jgi:hypothetical protein
MRVAAVIGVIAVTLSAALYVHLRRVVPNDHMTFFNARTTPPQPSLQLRNLSVGIPRKKVHPSWEDPVAILLSAGGVVAGAGILTVRRRPAAKAA